MDEHQSLNHSKWECKYHVVQGNRTWKCLDSRIGACPIRA